MQGVQVVLDLLLIAAMLLLLLLLLRVCRVYELYSDYVLKNPFCEVEQVSQAAHVMLQHSFK